MQNFTSSPTVLSSLGSFSFGLLAFGTSHFQSHSSEGSHCGSFVVSFSKDLMVGTSAFLPS